MQLSTLTPVVSDGTVMLSALGRAMYEFLRQNLR